MLSDIIKQFDWLDIVVIILLVRIIYVGVKSGLVSDLFKLIGTILGTYLALHYYSSLSGFISEKSGFDKSALGILDFAIFIILLLVGYFIFVGIRIVVIKLVKMEAHPLVDKWGGFASGIFRAALFTGVIIYIMMISNVAYLKNSVTDSFSGKYISNVSPSTYSFLWNNIMSKFMSGEKFNDNVFLVRDSAKK